MKPNIFFLTIDSLRADKIFGKTKTSLTPNIDNLIKRGTYCTQAISSADGTGITLGSLFTGCYPFTTGLTHFKFNPNAVTYFQKFKNNGYYTCATIPDISFLLKFTEKVDDKDPYVYDNRRSWLKLNGGIGQQIINKLEGMPKTPWLYYIHLQDLHSPFFIPKEFNSKKYGETDYERMISSIDLWIGKFLEKIDLSNTVVIISADHGDPIPVIDKWNDAPSTPKILLKGKKAFPALEPLGFYLFVKFNHLKKQYKINKIKNNLTEKQLSTLSGARGHNHLYDEQIRVPLIFAGPNIPSSKVISDQVRQIDIFPTIADIANSKEINDNIDGTTLVPLFNGDAFEETSAYIETTAAQKPGTTKIDLTLIGKIIGVRTSRYKYWRSRTDSKKDVYLFDLENDPSEEENIASNQPDVVNTMEQLLKSIIQKSPKIDDEKLSKDDNEEIEAELRKLGYL